jgi:hypothetical protein
LRQEDRRFDLLASLVKVNHLTIVDLDLMTTVSQINGPVVLLAQEIQINALQRAGFAIKRLHSF